MSPHLNTARLIALRKEHHLTQSDFANLLNVSQAAVGNWELGKREPDLETLSRIADYFQVSVDYLLGRSNDPAPEQKGPLLPTLAMNLRYYRLASHLSTSQAAKLADVPAGTWLSWEQGKALPSDEELARAAEVIGVSVSDLGIDAEQAEETIPGLLPVKKKKIPVLGEIACGKPIFADEQREVWVSVSEELVCDYALIAKGDSMLPRIRDGDLVFIREMPVVENGKIAAVLIENEATLKRVFFDPEKHKLMLVPDNPAYQPFMYVGDELETVRILGLAVAAQTRL